jgi:hypothetical protein
MQQRRHFIRSAGMLAGATLLGAGQTLSAAGKTLSGAGRKRALAIPGSRDSNAKKLAFGIISDLHHLQFGQDQDESARMKGFMDAVMLNAPDFIIQNGDFFRPQGADAIMSQWNRYNGPKYEAARWGARRL